MTTINKSKYHFPMQIKEIAADGSFEGILAVYGNVGLGKDLIEPGAFTKTVQEHGAEVPMLWQHNTNEPIGMLTLTDGPDALHVKGQLLMDLPMAQKAYLLLKAQIIKGLSIGYDSIKDSIENGVRHLKELRLWEGSIVTFPMNEAAVVTSIKARGETKEDFATELSEIQLRDAGYQLMCALQNALWSMIWASGLTNEEKESASQATVQQFSGAYLAFLPLYLAFLTQEYGGMSVMSRGALETKARAVHLKVGRRFSAATEKSLKEAHSHVMGLSDIFGALFPDTADGDPDDDEGDDTADAEAATAIPEPEVKDNHSAAKILGDLRSLIPTA